MIRFCAQGAYLHLVLQGRTFILDRALITFLGNNRMFETFIFISKRTIFETVTVTNTDGECSVNVSERLTLKLARHLPMELFFFFFTFVKKARIENKV